MTLDPGTPGLPDRFRAHSSRRVTLLAAGIATALLGLAAILSTLTLAKWTLKFLGVLLVLAGLVKLGQWAIGRLRDGPSTRGFLVVLGEAAIEVACGCFLIGHARLAIPVLSLILGLGLAADGIIQTFLAFKQSGLTSRISLHISGAASIVVAVLAVVFCRDPESMRWIGLLLGAKLLLFGAALVLISLTAPADDDALVYGSSRSLPTEKVPGELYAVFFGPAFHLGVYIGGDEVVDYLNDNKVRRVSWETFLEGRRPQHWEYPDLPPVPPSEVIHTAVGCVGRERAYSFLKFNCENFAIYCKSGGRTIHSAYAQVSASVETVRRHPFLGSLLESYSRVFQWIAYTACGSLGKKAALGIRYLSARAAGLLMGGSQRESAEAVNSGLASPEHDRSASGRG
jgi:uncharacterized membrane protein HdeD (DUF308 family)